MANYLKRPFIMFLIFSCLVVGWQTISCNIIFNGVAVPFVGIIVLLGLLTYTLVINKEVRHRIMDLYVIACVFAVLEFVVYLVLEFRLGNYHTWHGFNIFQNVICVLGLVYFLYIVFRAIYEAKGLRCGVLEILLGNQKPVKKVKQAKEFTNGSLEEKPNHKYKDDVLDITAQVEQPAAIKPEENLDTSQKPVEAEVESTPVQNENEDNLQPAHKAEGEE